MLAERAAMLLGAEGAALALLESDDVLVAEPIGVAASLHVPGRRIALDARTVLTAAIREDTLVRANDRDELERDFPDSAAILPARIRSVVAVPLHVARRPYGVVEFLYDRENAVDDASRSQRPSQPLPSRRSSAPVSTIASARPGRRSTASCRSRRASTPTPPTR